MRGESLFVLGPALEPCDPCARRTHAATCTRVPALHPSLPDLFVIPRTHSYHTCSARSLGALCLDALAGYGTTATASKSALADDLVSFLPPPAHACALSAGARCASLDCAVSLPIHRHGGIRPDCPWFATLGALEQFLGSPRGVSPTCSAQGG